MKRSESKTANAVRSQLILSLTLGEFDFLGMLMLSTAGMGLAFGILIRSSCAIALALILNAAVWIASLLGFYKFHKVLKNVER